jgi:hypothetical protein
MIDQFRVWLSQQDPALQTTVGSDGKISTITATIHDRVVRVHNVGVSGGVVNDLKHVLSKINLASDYYLLGDNSVFTQLELGDLASLAESTGNSVVGTYPMTSAQAAGLSQAIVNSSGQIVHMHPPGYAAQPGALAGVPAYFLRSGTIPIIQQYSGVVPVLNYGALGRYLLQNGEPFRAWSVPGAWHPVNNLANYRAANATWFAHEATEEKIRQALRQHIIPMGTRINPAQVALALQELPSSGAHPRFRLNYVYGRPLSESVWGSLDVRVENKQVGFIENFTSSGAASADMMAQVLVSHAVPFTRAYCEGQALAGIRVDNFDVRAAPGTPLRRALDQLVYQQFLSANAQVYLPGVRASEITQALPPTWELQSLSSDDQVILYRYLQTPVAGTVVVSGSPTAPSLSINGVAVIQNGQFLGEGARLLPGDVLEVTLAGGRVITTAFSHVIDALGRAGMADMPFQVPQGGTPVSIVLSQAGLSWNNRLLGLPGPEVAYVGFHRKLPAPNSDPGSAVVLAQVAADSEARARTFINLAGGTSPEQIRYIFGGIDADGALMGTWRVSLKQGLEVGTSWDALRNIYRDAIVMQSDGMPTPAGWVRMTQNPGVFEVTPNGANQIRTPSYIDLDAILQSDMRTVLRGFGLEAWQPGQPLPPQLTGPVREIATEVWFDAPNERFIVVRRNIADWIEGDPWAGGQQQRARWITRNVVDGITEIKMRSGEAQVVAGTQIRPTAEGSKRIFGRLMSFLSRPGVPALTTFTLAGTLMIYGYADGEYHPTSEVMGDVVGLLVLTGIAQAEDSLIRYAAERLAQRGVRMGLGEGFVALIPLMVLTDFAYNYSRAFYRQWAAQSSFLDVAPFQAGLIEGSAYRAWLSVMNDYSQGWHYFLRPQTSVMKEVLKAALVEGLMSRWASTAEGREAYRILGGARAEDFGYDSVAGTGISAPRPAQRAHNLVKDKEYDAGQLADVYMSKYQQNVIDPLLKGLSFNDLNAVDAGAGIPGNTCWLDYDDYGWLPDRDACWNSAYDYRATYPQGTSIDRLPVYVSKEAIRDNLVPRLFNLWDIWARGESSLDPISTILGYTPSLNEVRAWAVQDLYAWAMLFQMQEEDNSISSSPATGDPRDFVWNVGTTRALDTRVGTFMCLDLAGALSTVDFGQYGLYDTLLPNPGFETLDTSLRALPSVMASTNALTLDTNTTLRGVRYFWDVQGRNAAGPGERSEQRSFVPVTAP